MERSDLESTRSVPYIEDTFELARTPAGTDVTRTTTAQVLGPFAILKRIELYIALKQVHRYVFRNWLRLVRQGPGPVAGLA